MSMTPEERKAWAYELLDRWRAAVEISEFFSALEDSEMGIRDQLDGIERALATHDDRLSEVEWSAESLTEKVGELQGVVDTLAG